MLPLHLLLGYRRRQQFNSTFDDFQVLKESNGEKGFGDESEGSGDNYETILAQMRANHMIDMATSRHKSGQHAVADEYP